LASAFRTVDLGDATLRESADADRGIEVDRSRRNRLDLHLRAILAHLHNGALPERLLDLRHREPKRLLAIVLLCNSRCRRCLGEVKGNLPCRESGASPERTAKKSGFGQTPKKVRNARHRSSPNPRRKRVPYIIYTAKVDNLIT